MAIEPKSKADEEKAYQALHRLLEEDLDVVLGGAALETMAAPPGGELDVLVVGAGVVGAGTALDAVTARVVPVAQGVAKQQPVERDIAVIVAESVTHGQLMQAIHAASTEGSLQSAVLFDIYRPKADAPAGALAVGEKSLAVRLTLGQGDAPLTDAQIDAAMNAVVSHLGQQLGARLRG